MSTTPKITVLMPAYNAERFIARAIDSVLSQTFADFELLVVNDGSTDNTAGIIQSFNDPRIVVLHQQNKGVAAALNVGLKHARSPYIARFDADDICYPERLAAQYEFTQANPQYAVIGSAADYTDIDDGFVFTYQPPVLSTRVADHAATCPFIHSTAMYRKDVVLAMGGYDKNAYAFEDHLLWIKLLKQYCGFNLPQPLIRVRLSPDSVTVDDQWQHPKFKKIKQEALNKRYISAAEGKELKQLRLQQNKGTSNKAYHGLLAKKFLWNNYQPVQARQNLLKLIKLDPFSVRAYTLLLLSVLPALLISKIYILRKGQKIQLPVADAATASLPQIMIGNA